MKYVLALCLLFCASANMQAQTEYTTSITISPVHLTLPFLEVTVETLTRTGSGVAGIIGAGEYEDTKVIEIGMQYNYYVLGSFQNGAELGFEALLVRGFSGNAFNMSFGPQLGYKVILSGLTFHAQGGYAFSPISTSGFFLNLNTGWSF